MSNKADHSTGIQELVPVGSCLSGNQTCSVTKAGNTMLEVAAEPFPTACCTDSDPGCDWPVREGLVPSRSSTVPTILQTAVMAQELIRALFGSLVLRATVQHLDW
jgi:hypothetical protein